VGGLGEYPVCHCHCKDNIFGVCVSLGSAETLEELGQKDNHSIANAYSLSNISAKITKIG